MEHLFEKLVCNGESDIYPCHMPGHKRNVWGELPAQLCRLDITEIEGFDNLHQPEGLLLELQKKAAELYGAEESFYLINGSTCGILSAVSAALPAGGHILMARNCHKSAYHAAYLRNLKISYLYPAVLEEYNIVEAVTPKQVSRGLEKAPDAGAVLVVSPTYEGRIADIAGISEVVHKRGIPLIVDEAHGAHLGLSREVHENSCRQGADLVIQSVHKTLPALTQTALLHVNGKLTDRELLKRFLHIYQSSSPSYLLMASIDNALHYIEKEGERAFREFRRQYEGMLDRLSRCRVLKFLPADGERQDLGKLLISVRDAEITGRQLYDVLLHRYRIQAEMAAEDFVLAMFTINDRPEGYERVTAALLEIDGSLKGRERRKESPEGRKGPGGRENIESPEGRKSLEDRERSGDLLRDRICPEAPGTGGCSLTAAWDGSKEEIPLEECAGRLAGEFVNLYPPGVPLLVPGEKITEELCRKIFDWLRHGLTVQGIRQQEGKYLVRVLKPGR
ncbi:MAG: aminotransferase class I/II-fold pyridoxal phosphate-dependent enzyme [Firmicutes bacterium]|nr:aminotransferase class I/II-fold pyridoxal phosphate-dependent enzyme [Bacillota bacterium]